MPTSGSYFALNHLMRLALSLLFIFINTNSVHALVCVDLLGRAEIHPIWNAIEKEFQESFAIEFATGRHEIHSLFAEIQNGTMPVSFYEAMGFDLEIIRLASEENTDSLLIQEAIKKGLPTLLA